MGEPLYRRYVLVVDDGLLHKQITDGDLVSEFRKRDVVLTFVFAKDGAQAALKVVNQKFDAIILNTEVPRMTEGGFAHNVRSIKNTREGQLYVVCAGETDKLPEALKTGKIFSGPFDPNDLIEVLKEDLLKTIIINNDGNAAKEPPKKYSVDVTVINAVISATVKVLQQFGMAGIKMTPAVSKAPNDPLAGEISSVIDIISEKFHGHLSISFDKQSFLELVSVMFGEEQTEINADNQDAVGEINNIIYGNAKSDLAQFHVKMSIPRVLRGAGQVVPAKEGSAAMRVPFETSKGRFYIEVVAFPLG